LSAVVVRWVDRPPPGWEALVAEDPGATPAHEPAVASAIAAVVPGMRAEFLVHEEDGALVGGAVVVVERRASFQWLHALPWLLPGAPLARPGRHADVDRAMGAALAERAASLGVVGGEWSGYRAAGPALDDAALEAIGGETRTLESALIDLAPDMGPAWRKIEPRTRQKLQLSRRQGLRFEDAPDRLDEAYALHGAQSRAWGGHRPLPLELSRRLVAGIDGGPRARLFAITDDRGLLSATLVLVTGREAFAWWSGTHAEGRRRRAFPLLLWSAAEWAAQQGCARFNLGASAGRDEVSDFKRTLGARALRYPVRWFDARYAGPAGRLVASLQRFARRGRARGEPA
jgi:hypothetical protein